MERMGRSAGCVVGLGEEVVVIPPLHAVVKTSRTPATLPPLSSIGILPVAARRSAAPKKCGLSERVRLAAKNCGAGDNKAAKALTRPIKAVAQQSAISKTQAW